MKEFHAAHKHHIRLWITLALITAISGYISYVWEPKSVQQALIIVQPKQEILLEDAVKETVEQKEEPKIVYTSLDNLVSTTTEAEITAHAILRIEDLVYSIPIEPGNTAYDLMAKAQTDGLIRFSARDYGGDLGQLVEEINGVKSGARGKKYWIYYINGKKAQVGISTYKPQAGDIISWQYEDEAV